MGVPFWEKSYQDETISAFGTEPNKLVKKYESLFDQSWRILEIGCGEGKNPIYLAENGFQNIDAFDLSGNGIAKLCKMAENKGLRVNAWVQDLCDFRFQEQYDLIISYGTLHFVEKQAWRSLLLKAKESTNAGGLHIIHIFTNVAPASPDIEAFAVGLADDKEIEAIYGDWDIVEFNSYVIEDEHPGAAKHLHAVNTVVARRLSFPYVNAPPV